MACRAPSQDGKCEIKDGDPWQKRMNGCLPGNRQRNALVFRCLPLMQREKAETLVTSSESGGERYGLPSSIYRIT